MQKADWKQHYRRVRCGSRKADARAILAYLNRTSNWEACAAIRAHWLTRPTMRAHKLTLIGDSRRALFAVRPRLP